MRLTIMLAGGSLLVCTPAFAQETTTFSYDALGRLTGASVSSGPNSGVSTTIDYDPAGNRTRYRVAGAAAQGGDPNGGSGTPSQPMFIVVPLNGFTVIPIM